MLEEYDIDKLNPRPNPYIRKNKSNITIRLDDEVLEYFKSLSEDLDIPYQTLINSFLKDCAKIKGNWSGARVLKALKNKMGKFFLTESPPKVFLYALAKKTPAKLVE